MDFVGLLYPVASFIFLRGAVRSLEAWASLGKPVYLIMGIALMGLTIDAGARLIAVAVTAPYWWLLPLVIAALTYVAFRTVRKSWHRLK